MFTTSLVITSQTPCHLRFIESPQTYRDASKLKETETHTCLQKHNGTSSSTKETHTSTEVSSSTSVDNRLGSGSSTVGLGRSRGHHAAVDRAGLSRNLRRNGAWTIGDGDCGLRRNGVFLAGDCCNVGAVGGSRAHGGVSGILIRRT